MKNTKKALIFVMVIALAFTLAIPSLAAATRQEGVNSGSSLGTGELTYVVFKDGENSKVAIWLPESRRGENEDQLREWFYTNVLVKNVSGGWVSNVKDITFFYGDDEIAFSNNGNTYRLDSGNTVYKSDGKSISNIIWSFDEEPPYCGDDNDDDDNPANDDDPANGDDPADDDNDDGDGDDPADDNGGRDHDRHSGNRHGGGRIHNGKDNGDPIDNDDPTDDGDPIDNNDPADDGDPDDKDDPDDKGDPDDKDDPDDNGNPDDSGDPDDNGDPDDVKEEETGKEETIVNNGNNNGGYISNVQPITPITQPVLEVVEDEELDIVLEDTPLADFDYVEFVLDVPLADLPPEAVLGAVDEAEEEILDPDVPLGELPQTGTSSIYSALFAMSALLTGAGVALKAVNVKKNEN
ncbi:MAG: LPXTG cell wall anchor domain-containing protein [Oscillospiraceae bacterium]|nr:LPXTG cell wall anchor domain-containing protein [Oscillospiraceae bacterium]